MRKSYDYHCSTCERDFIGLIEEDDRDNAQLCPRCGYDYTKRVYRTFNASTRNSATFVDGQRGKSKAWQEMRIQNELEDRVHDADFGSDSLDAQRELDNFKKTIKID